MQMKKEHGYQIRKHKTILNLLEYYKNQSTKHQSTI